MSSWSARWRSASWLAVYLALVGLATVAGWWMGYAASQRRIEPDTWNACFVLVDGQPMAQSRRLLACGTWSERSTDVLVRRVR